MTKQKNPIESNARAVFTIRPFYTLEELRKLLGYKTRHSTKAFLDKLNIPANMVGNKNIFYLSDLQTYSPELFNSLCEAANLNNLIQQPVLEVQDEEETHVSQFRS